MDGDRPNDDSASTALSIRLFGDLEVQLGGQQLPRLESARARSLLAFLLLHRDAPQPRQRLAFLLWPDSTEAQARTNLRHLLHTLRQASPELDRFLEVTAQTLRWRGDGSSWIDVAAFDAAQAAADAPGVTARHEREALRASIDLYRGDLLDGCYDEWVLDVRDRFRERYLSHLQRLAEALAADGEHGEAIRVARELQRHDPLREDTTRFLMRAHLAAGDRAAAVRTFHECASTLRRELGVDPSRETLSAYADLTATDPGDATDGPPVRMSESPLVGRDREWAEMIAHWRTAESGGPQLLLLTGEPGVGKTRLLDEFAASCAHEGALVATARSYSIEGNLGFDATISWLRCPEVVAALHRMELSDRAVLSRLLPDLLDISGAPALQELDASEDRRRLFETLAKVFIAVDRAVLLVADDVQWCDEQTVQLMHYLIRRDVQGRLLIVASARTEDIDGTAAGSLFAGLQARDRGIAIPIGRLSRHDTGELVRNLADLNIDDAGLDEIYADTEGNPLFIVEAIHAGWSAADSATGTPLSPKLHAVIASRLGQLSPSARELVGVAATVGREFRAAILARAVGRDDVGLVGDLDELWRRGIIREHGIDSYDFAHGKIRDVAYDSLSAAATRHNHRCIADALINVHDETVDEVSGDIARHLDHAGQYDEAIRWYRRAAGQAQRVHADVEAVRLFERALDLVAMLPAGRARSLRELEILSAFVTPLAVTEGFASTRFIAAQSRAIDLSGQLEREPEDTVLRSATMSMLCRDDFDGARDVARRLSALADSQGDEGMRVESRYLLGIGSFWNGDFQSARTHFEEVVRSVDPVEAVDHRVRFGHDARVVCLSRLANTLWFLGATDEARAARDEAVAMAVDTGHPFSRGVAFVFAALVSIDLDEPQLLADYVAELSKDVDHRPSAVAGDAIAGYVDVLDGRSDEGIARIRRTIEGSFADPIAINHAPGQLATHTRLLLGAHLLAARPADGLAAADLALQAPGTRIWEPEMRRLRATFLAAVGSPRSEVDAELTRASGVAERFGAIGSLRRIERTRVDLHLQN